jgi:hypothetical protein
MPEGKELHAAGGADEPELLQSTVPEACGASLAGATVAFWIDAPLMVCASTQRGAKTSSHRNFFILI